MMASVSTSVRVEASVSGRYVRMRPEEHDSSSEKVRDLRHGLPSGLPLGKAIPVPTPSGSVGARERLGGQEMEPVEPGNEDPVPRVGCR